MDSRVTGAPNSTSSSSINSSLLLRLREHDRDAWQRLVHVYSPLIYASAAEIPVLVKDAAIRLPGHRDEDSHGHRRGGICIAAGSLCMAAALILLVFTVAGLSKAYRLSEMGFPIVDGIRAMISSSLNWLVYAVPSFVVGLFLLIVGYRQRGQLDASIFPVHENRKRPTGVGMFLTAIATILLLTTGAMAVFLLNTPHGQLEIRTSDEHVKVEVRRAGKIKIIDTSTKDSIELTIGEYGIRVVGDDKKRFQLDTDRFTIRRGEKAIVQVSLASKNDDVEPGSPPSPEPTYSGKPLSFWAAQLKDRDPNFRQKAVDAIVSFGASGVPALVEMLNDDVVQAQFQALNALPRLAPEGKAAVPRLIELLDDPNKEIRRQTLLCLMELKEVAKPAQKAVLAKLEDEDSIARRRAIWSLGFIKADRDAIVQPLVKALESESAYERRAAAFVLGQGRSHAEQIIPALAKALATYSSRSNDVQRHIKSSPTETDEFLSRHGVEFHSTAVTMAIEALAGFGEQADEEILKLSQNKEVRIQAIAVKALQKRGTLAAINRIVAIRNDERPDEPAYVGFFPNAIDNALYATAGTKPATFLRSAESWDADTRAEIVAALAPRFIPDSGEGGFEDVPRQEQFAKDAKLTIDVLTRSIITHDKFKENHAIAASAILAIIDSDEAKNALNQLKSHESRKVRDVIAKVLTTRNKTPEVKAKPD